jgi:hypothetical protein
VQYPASGGSTARDSSQPGIEGYEIQLSFVRMRAAHPHP